MEAEGKKRVVFIALMFLGLPWALVQGWIVLGAPNPEHTTMPSCPEQTMNCAFLSPSETVRMDGALVTVIEANISEVWAAWEVWSDDNGLREVLDDTQTDGERFSHRVAITPFWRFPDDVVVLFVPQGEDTSITLYSASRLGQSDLGVNPERLEDLHAALVAVQATS